jgi:hypothetical protein
MLSSRFRNSILTRPLASPRLLRRNPDTSTNADPGSPEKIRVLAHRAALGQNLWHPDDVTWLPTSADASTLIRTGTIRLSPQAVRAAETEDAAGLSTMGEGQ